VTKSAALFFVALSLALALLLHGCEIGYQSRIRIDQAISGPNGTKQEAFLKTAFNGFCDKAGFYQAPPPDNKSRSLNKEREMIAQCEKAWFYILTLSKQGNAYSIDLILSQPGPWRTKTAFFCAESKEMFDYFEAVFGESGIRIELYPGCR
jgi:hypothetical protein